MKSSLICFLKDLTCLLCRMSLSQHLRSGLGYAIDKVIQCIDHIFQNERTTLPEKELKATVASANSFERWDMFLKFLRNTELSQGVMVYFEKIRQNDYNVHVYNTGRKTRIFSRRISVHEYHQILNNTEQCSDTLYDGIWNLKFRFLLEYTGKQQQYKSPLESVSPSLNANFFELI